MSKKRTFNTINTCSNCDYTNSNDDFEDYMCDCLPERDPTGTVIFTFGRFNPPHKGHEAMIDKMLEMKNSDFGSIEGSVEKNFKDEMGDPGDLKNADVFIDNIYYKKQLSFFTLKFNTPINKLKGLYSYKIISVP